MTTTKTKPAGRANGSRSRANANKAALRDAVATLNDGSAEAYLALFRSDARLHGFPTGVEDIDGLRRFHADTSDLFPGATVLLDDAVAEGDRVATRFTWQAGGLVARGGAVVRFSGGKIAECWNLPTELHANGS
jgi:hypothetical protein